MGSGAGISFTPSVDVRMFALCRYIMELKKIKLCFHGASSVVGRVDRVGGGCQSQQEQCQMIHQVMEECQTVEGSG